MAEKVQANPDSVWWLVATEGVATIVLGILAIFFPGLTLSILLILFALYAILMGVITIIGGISGVGKTSFWFVSLILGLLAVGIGVYLIRHPLISLGTFIVFVGSLLLLRGIYDLMMAIFGGNRTDHRWLWAISGILGVVAGVLVWNNPVSGGLAFVWILGFYAIMTGSMMLALAMQLSSIER